MASTVSATISDDTLNRIITIESAGKPTAKAKTSSAYGLGQFLDGTWLEELKQHRPDLFNGPPYDDELAYRKDPSMQIELLARFTEDNARDLGGGYTDGDLYLAHFLGIGGARKMFRAAPGASAASIAGEKAAKANRSIFYDKRGRAKTAKQVRDWAAARMAASGGHDWVARYYKGAQEPAEFRIAMSGAYSALCEDVQATLKSMGYNPGFLDGKWGGETRAQVGAFQNDRGRADRVPVIDEWLIKELQTAKREGFKRPIAEARKNATAEQLAPRLPEVAAAKKAGFLARIQGWFSSIMGGGTAYGIVQQVMPAKEQVDPYQSWFSSLFSDLPHGVVTLLTVAAVIGVAIYLTRKAAGAADDAVAGSVAAFQEGARK